MKRFFTNVTIFSMLAQPLYAAETANAPGASVYDKHPACMERTYGTAANPNCVVHNGPPHRKVIGASSAARTNKSDRGAAQSPGNRAGAQASRNAGTSGSAMTR
ncbi:MAG: hypothetical protein HYX63_18310 [Gammaproteobacteria bacterium]|nr:hypothetical protein [Gammaproteobacteria bacterium]